jgi:hypothetical protein
MAQQDQTTTAPDNEGAANAFDGAVNALNATSKNMQAIAGDFEISKQSFEHTTQTLEKLRAAYGMDEVLAIQTNFVKEACEHSAQHAQKFSELMTACQAEITKTYQDAWLKSVNRTVKATEEASQTTAESIDRLSDAARKAANVFDRRESA